MINYKAINSFFYIVLSFSLFIKKSWVVTCAPMTYYFLLAILNKLSVYSRCMLVGGKVNLLLEFL